MPRVYAMTALSGGKDARAKRVTRKGAGAKRITRWINVFEDELGLQWPGSLQSSRAGADAVAKIYSEDWNGKRRRIYVLRVSAQRGAVLVEGPWVPRILPSAPGARR